MRHRAQIYFSEGQERVHCERISAERGGCTERWSSNEIGGGTSWLGAAGRPRDLCLRCTRYALSRTKAVSRYGMSRLPPSKIRHAVTVSAVRDPIGSVRALDS